jgi:proteasome lid subunit RPN8/RPN11
MFYVSIEKGVLDKVMERAKSTENEIIGVLIGTIEEHTILISDAVSGEQEQESTRATLPPTTIAKVTDKILKGELKGRIVGWYHSHPGFGLFMSSTDVNTQKNLQQFSSKVTALIVDPDCEEFGFFTLHNDLGVLQLEKNQVHVYDDGEEKIPESFSEPPKIPKQPSRRRKVAAGVPRSSRPKGPNIKFMAVGIAAALAFAAISAFIFYKEINQDPVISTVDSIVIIGDSYEYLDDSIYKGDIEIRSNITVKEGKITEEGVRFYVSLIEGGWEDLDNDPIPDNGTYNSSFNSIDFGEGIHQIKVNFTDSFNHTWERLSEKFIINNILDVPQVRFIDPEDGVEVSENVTFLANITDSENNIHDIGFYYSNQSGNWSKINDTLDWEAGNIYTATLNTNLLSDEPYIIKVEVVDRNLYKGMDEITVIISNGG